MRESENPSIRLDEKLWQAIAAHSFNAGPAALTFERRLARDTDWAEEFAARVIAEYRRFLYLAARAGHPVTPSEAVDEAWHLHLCYTRNYWDVMCAQVLGQPLHHGPTLGGAEETTKFTDWYSRTLESYRAHFGEDPPADIWPTPAARFQATATVRRVDTSRHWVIPKPAFKLPRLFPTVAGLTLAALLLAPHAARAGNPSPSSLRGEVTILFAGCLIVHILMLRSGYLAAGLLFSAMSAAVFANYYAKTLLATPSMILWGLIIWVFATTLVCSLYYRRRRPGTRQDQSNASGCGGGCVMYIGGSDGGPGDSGASSGGDSGGSGCGGGCGGGD